MSIFRVVKIVFDRFVNNPSFARVVKLLYIPPLRGGMYITFLTALARIASSLSSAQQFDRLQEGERMNARQLSVERLAQDVLRCCAQAGSRGRFTQHTTIFGQSRACVYLYPAACVFAQPGAGLSCRASGCRAVFTPGDGSAQLETTWGVGGLT